MTPAPTTQSLANARLQLHYAIQPIAATGAALATPQPDDSHSSLQWDPSINCFVGNLIQTQQSFRVALEPVNLFLRILDEQGSAIAELPLAGKTLAEAIDWVQGAIAPLGSDSSQIKLLSYPPDDFPDHPIAHGTPFDSTEPEARAVLATYYAVTDRLLQHISKRTASSCVRIWPHHFDMATLVTRSVQNGVTYTIGIGLSPGDTSYPEPYWYVSPYPYPDIASLPDLGGDGIWHIQHWVGAVLPASSLKQDVSETKAVEQIQQFLDRAIEVLW